MYVIEDELDHFDEKSEKIIQYRFSCQKGQIGIRILYIYSGSDLAKMSRIRPNPDPDPQHCFKVTLFNPCLSQKKFFLGKLNGARMRNI